jgi:hypothetical protein
MPISLPKHTAPSALSAMKGLDRPSGVAVRRCFLQRAHPEGRCERPCRHPFGIDGEDEGSQRLAPAAGAAFQRLPELRLQCDTRAMPGNAEATFDQHVNRLASWSDSAVNIPNPACR